jgi:hypothetical protein
MARYDALSEHLQTLDRSRDHTMRFVDIEKVLGFQLPQSARTHHAWWANQSNGRHVQAKAWHAAGWNTKEPNLVSDRVTFTPKRNRPTTGADFVRALTISEAKRAIALQCGVRPEDVEITIRS